MPNVPLPEIEALVESVRDAIVNSGHEGISRGELRSRFPLITTFRLKRILQHLSNSGAICELRQRRPRRQFGETLQVVYRATPPRR